jgi:hypothetical protein
MLRLCLSVGFEKAVWPQEFCNVAESIFFSTLNRELFVLADDKETTFPTVQKLCLAYEKCVVSNCGFAGLAAVD